MSDWALETERLRLRRVTLDDAEFMLEIWNDPAFVRHVGDRGVRTIEQAREAMRSGLSQTRMALSDAPNSEAWLAPGTRLIASSTYRLA